MAARAPAAPRPESDVTGTESGLRFSPPDPNGSATFSSNAGFGSALERGRTPRSSRSWTSSHIRPGEAEQKVRDDTESYSSRLRRSSRYPRPGTKYCVQDLAPMNLRPGRAFTHDVKYVLAVHTPHLGVIVAVWEA